MKTYLIVEDSPTKAHAFLRFGQAYAKQCGVRLQAVSSPSGAIAVLHDPSQRAAIDGVIVDFELGCRREDNRHLRAHVTDAAGQPYAVSTGMGVLDWVHTADPDMPLWALTNDAATHAPLYMSAANLWLNARPLHVDRLSAKPESPAAVAMVEELRDPDAYEELNPHAERVDLTSVVMGELLNTDYMDVEAYDWLHALTHLIVGTDGFIPALTKRIRGITGDESLNAYANTLSPEMATWQLLLEEIYEEFPVDRDEKRWPDIDRKSLPKSLKPWAEFNPITGFLGQQPECREFFGSADVRVALMNWRARGEHP